MNPSEAAGPQLSEFELECKLRKELGLSAYGMVEHREIPWRLKIIFELMTRKR